MTTRTAFLATTLVTMLLVATRVAGAGGAAPPPDNPNIDMAGFLRAANEAAFGGGRNLRARPLR